MLPWRPRSAPPAEGDGNRNRRGQPGRRGCRHCGSGHRGRWWHGDRPGGGGYRYLQRGRTGRGGAVGRHRCRWRRWRGGRFLLLPGGAGPLPRGLGEGVPLVQVGNDHVHPEGQAVNGPDHVAQARFLGLFRAGALRLFAHLHRGAFPDVLRGDSRLEGTGCAGGGIGKTPGRPAAGSWAAAVPVALRRIPPPGWQR